MLNGNQTRAVAEVADDRPPPSGGTEHADDVLVREPVKAVPSQPLAPEFARKRKPLRQLGHGSMEGCVETRGLREIGKVRRHRADDLELAGKMKRRERDQLAKRGEQRRVDPLWPCVIGSAVHEPVPDSIGSGESMLLEGVEYLPHGRAMLGELAGHVGQRLAMRTPQPETTIRLAESFDHAAREQRLRLVAHPIQGEFER